MPHRVTTVGLAAALAAGLTGCLAPDVDRQGAMGLVVDEEGRPVLLVEPCGGSVVTVTLSRTREGLDPTETNRLEGEWTAARPPTELTEMVLHQPGPIWIGPEFTPRPGLGYIAEAGDTSRSGHITQVAFWTDELTDLQPDTVYVGPDPSTDDYRVLTREAFVDWACSGS